MHNLFLRRTHPTTIINVNSPLFNIPVMLVRFYWNLNFLEKVLKNSQILIFMKICPVGTELFHADEKADRQTDIRELLVAFCDFAKMSKNQFLYDVSVESRQRMLTYSGRNVTVKYRGKMIGNRNYASRHFSRDFVKK